MSTREQRITVFYDGACPACVRDRAQYEKLAGKTGDAVHWVDITGRDEQLRQLGIDPDKAMRELHVVDEQQRVLVELDAYIALMKKVPALRPLAWVIGKPFIRPLLSAVYRRQVDRRLRREGRI